MVFIYRCAIYTILPLCQTLYPPPARWKSQGQPFTLHFTDRTAFMLSELEAKSWTMHPSRIRQPVSVAILGRHGGRPSRLDGAHPRCSFGGQSTQCDRFQAVFKHFEGNYCIFEPFFTFWPGLLTPEATAWHSRNQRGSFLGRRSSRFSRWEVESGPEVGGSRFRPPLLRSRPRPAP